MAFPGIGGQGARPGKLAISTWCKCGARISDTFPGPESRCKARRVEPRRWTVLCGPAPSAGRVRTLHSALAGLGRTGAGDRQCGSGELVAEPWRAGDEKTWRVNWQL